MEYKTYNFWLLDRRYVALRIVLPSDRRLLCTDAAVTSVNVKQSPPYTSSLRLRRVPTAEVSVLERVH